MQERQIDNVQDLAAEITNHAFEKHQQEFQNKELGQEIKVETKEDLAKHVLAILESSETKCFKVEDGFEKGTCYFYNQETNTFIVVPGEKNLDPTCFRPKEFERKLDAKIEKTRDSQGAEPELKNGIHELLPELKKESQLERQPADNRQAQQLPDLVPEKGDTSPAKHRQFEPNDPSGPPTSAQARHQWATEGLPRNDPQAQRAALIVEEKQFASEQASLREAAEKFKDEAEKKRLELRAEIEKAEHNAVTKKAEAKLNGQENGFDSKESLRASREAKAADKTYEAGKQEWHKRSVRDESYQPFDAALSQKAEAAREREAANRAKLQARSKAEGWDHQREQAQREALQRKQDTALDQSFSLQSSYGHDR